jgi:hypothetical protein
MSLTLASLLHQLEQPMEEVENEEEHSPHLSRLP